MALRPDGGFFGGPRRRKWLWTFVFFAATMMFAGNAMTYYFFPTPAVQAYGKVVSSVPVGKGYNVTLALSQLNGLGLGGQKQSYVFHDDPPKNSTAFYGLYAYSTFFPFAGGSLFGTGSFSTDSVANPPVSYSGDARSTNLAVGAIPLLAVLAGGLVLDLKSRDFYIWRRKRKALKQIEKKHLDEEMKTLEKELEAQGT